MTARAGRWLIVLTVTAGIGLFSATRGHAQDDEASGNKGQSTRRRVQCLEGSR